MASLFLNNAARFWLILLIAFLLPDFPHNGPDGFTATNAIAAAAVRRILALVMRASEKKRVRVNQRGVFIYFLSCSSGVILNPNEGKHSLSEAQVVNSFNLTFL
jgi:hypothetical protein